MGGGEGGGAEVLFKGVKPFKLFLILPFLFLFSFLFQIKNNNNLYLINWRKSVDCYKSNTI